MPRPQELNAPLIGVPGGRARLATPALVLDRAAFEANLARMAQEAVRTGVKLRPHAKTHKCAEIGRKQLQAGAVGLCTAKLGEAEALADQGLGALLVTSPVVTDGGIARLVALNARIPELTAVVDNAQTAALLDAAARAAGKPLTVLVDLDIGLHRTGVAPGEAAVALALQVAEAKGLRFAGLQAYAGHLMHVPDYAERRAKSHEGLRAMQSVREALAARGVACRVMTGGGTGTWNIDTQAGVLTDIQVGSYVFMDKQYAEVKEEDGRPLAFATALFVQTTVISATMPGLVTTDAGLKSFATEAGPPLLASGAPEGASYFFFGDEQGGVLGAGGLKVGDVLACSVPHCDPTVNLHDVIHVVDGDTLVAIWPVDARGRSA